MALVLLGVTCGVAQAQVNDMKVYPLTAAEQSELSRQARILSKRECAGDYGKLIFPEASEAMAVSTIATLAADPSPLIGRGPEAKKRLINFRYEVGQKAVAQFVLQLKPGGPLTYQLYTHTTKGGQYLTIKQACRLR